jgi:hypothetical protein
MSMRSNHTPEIKSNLKSKRPWIPDEITIPGWIVFGMRGISKGAQLCYVLLRGYAKKRDRCFVSVGLMALHLGVSKAQVKRYTEELRDAGLIETKRRTPYSQWYIFQPLKIAGSFSSPGGAHFCARYPNLKKLQKATDVTHHHKSTAKLVILPGRKVAR